MSEAALSALDNRLTKLENDIPSALQRIEDLIRREIQDLKVEQIRDIKSDITRVERDLKEEAKRLADDQRRLWEATRALEGRENQRTGGGKALGSIGHVLSAGIGGLIALVGNWLSSGHTPHP